MVNARFSASTRARGKRLRGRSSQLAPRFCRRLDAARAILQFVHHFRVNSLAYFRCGRAYRGRRIRVMVRRVPMAVRFASCGQTLARARAGAGLLVAAVMAAPAHAEDAIKVRVDQAAITKLPATAVTIVIGNPLIADVTVQPGGLMVITGKGFGSTNMIALDRAGTVLTERNIEVVGPQDKVVVVYRGINRETYSCAPECENRITLGDAPAYFDATMSQAANRAARA